MKIGIIGCGAMGGGIARRLASAHEVFLTDHHSPTIAGIAQEVNGTICQSPVEVFESAEVVILAVKPKDLSAVADAVSGVLTKKHLLVSVLAGISLSDLEKAFKGPAILRMMPNLAVVFGEGVVGLAAEDSFDTKQKNEVSQLFSSLGLVKWFPESMMDALTSLTGSGPAFALVAIEAMIEAAIALGFSASDGRALVLQMLKGTIKLVEESKKHPGELKWQIASPAGTSIAGLKELEALGFRSAIMKAFIASYNRAQHISIESQ